MQKFVFWCLLYTLGCIYLVNGLPKCQQFRMEKDCQNCTTAQPCEVKYGIMPYGQTGVPRPAPSEFQATLWCIDEEISSTARIGLKISWKIKAAYIANRTAQEFSLIIREDSEVSEVDEAFVLITPNLAYLGDDYVKFVYYYTGLDNPEIPKILQNGRYYITLETVPIFHIAKVSKKSPLVKIVPKEFIKEKCSSNETATISIPSVKLRGTPWSLAFVFTSVFLLVCLVGLFAFLWKRKRDSDTATVASQQHRILILSTFDGGTEVARQTNWAATALSRVDWLGQVTVKFNRWESQQISRVGIVRWLDEKVSWANKIIISCTPDDMRDYDTAHLFENTLEKMLHKHSHSKMDSKQIFIIHFEDEENYKCCPYMNNEKFKKFHLNREWTALCKGIHGSPGTEQEPLDGQTEDCIVPT